MLTAIITALSLLFDLNHCARWVSTDYALLCADIRLDAECAWSGWHLTAQGIAVCVRGCGEEGPTS